MRFQCWVFLIHLLFHASFTIKENLRCKSNSKYIRSCADDEQHFPFTNEVGFHAKHHQSEGEEEPEKDTGKGPMFVANEFRRHDKHLHIGTRIEEPNDDPRCKKHPEVWREYTDKSN